ncbi:MAG: class I SAM-dependent methyltransferase [Planctomycetes bacterium]|nr:class I SAM-dependent methyltransferase [Planctomycetota bacterium]
MTSEDRIRWDAKHRAAAPAERPVSTLFRALEAAPRIKSRAPRALDVACGTGRHACALAALGWEVDAVDISSAGLAIAARHLAARGLRARLLMADLDEGWPLSAARYELVVVVNFHIRARFGELASALAPGGVLFLDGFLEGHPTQQPRWCYRTGELREAFCALECIEYEERDGRVLLIARREPDAATIFRP